MPNCKSHSCWVPPFSNPVSVSNPIVNPNGTLIINKVATPVAAGVGVTFGYTITPGPFNTSIGPLNISGTGSVSLDLPPGNYSVLESFPVGWSTFPNPQNVTIVAGGVVSLQFINEFQGPPRFGTIRIIKTAIAGSGTAAPSTTFNFVVNELGITGSIPFPAFGPGTVTGSVDIIVEAPATYSVTEISIPAVWTPTPNPPTISGILVAPGTIVPINFTNTIVNP